jgi:hypothetical protein
MYTIKGILIAPLLACAALCQTAGPQLIKTGIFLLPGSGGNVVMRLTYKGPVLVDAPRYGDPAALRKLSFKISDQPPALTLATEAKFASSGNAITQQGSNIEIGGIEVRVLRFDPERTGIDRAFYFPDLKVVAIGGLTESRAPGVSEALSDILKLDFEIAAPGNGPLLKRKDLLDWLERIRDTR